MRHGAPGVAGVLLAALLLSTPPLWAQQNAADGPTLPAPANTVQAPEGAPPAEEAQAAAGAESTSPANANAATAENTAATAEPERPRFNLHEFQAIRALRAARQSEDWDAVLRRSQAYLEEYAQGRFTDEVLMAQGAAQESQGQAAQAQASYTRLAQNHPDSAFRDQALLRRMALRDGQSEPRAMLADAEQLLREHPNSLYRSEAQYWKGVALAEQKQAELAAAAFADVETPQNLPPADRARYYRLQTRTSLELNRLESADAALQHYLQQQDDPAEQASLLLAVGQANASAGNTATALSAYGEAANRAPAGEQQGKAATLRAQLYDRSVLAAAPEGQRLAATIQSRDFHSAALEHAPPDARPGLLIRRAALNEQLGEDNAALEDYGALQGESLPPEQRAQAVERHVALLRRTGQPAAAITLLEEVRQRPGLSRETQTALTVQQATLAYDAQECPGVERLLNPMPIFSEQEPRNRALYMRGFCRMQAELWEEASWDLEGLLNEADYHDRVWEPLLVAYARSGQTSRMVNLTEQELLAGRVQPDAAMMTRLADGYDSLGRPEGMLSAYERLEALEPGAVRTQDVQIKIGRAYDALEQPKEALPHYEDVVRLNPVEAPYTPLAMEALEWLQSGYAVQGRYEALVRRNDLALGAAKTTEAQDKLRAWQVQAYLAWGRSEVDAKRWALALPPLEEGWLRRGHAEEATRQELLTLLVAAHARTDSLDIGLLRYADAREHAAQEQQAAYAQLLVTALLPVAEEQVQAKPPGLAMHHQLLATLKREDAKQRLQVVEHLEAHYPAEGDLETLLAVYRKELEGGGGHEYRQAIADRLVALQLREADKESAGGSPEQAIALYQGALEQLDPRGGPERQRVVSKLDTLYLAQGDAPARLAMYEQELALSSEPTYRREIAGVYQAVLIQTAQAEEQQGQNASAVKRYERALLYLPTSMQEERYYLLTRLDDQYAAAGEHELRPGLYENEERHAETDAQRAKLEQAKRSTYLDAGEKLEAAGQRQSAARVYRQAMPSFPPDRVEERYYLVNRLDALYADEGRDADRLALYREELQEQPPSAYRERLIPAMVASHRDVAERSELAGEPRKAAEVYANALEALPPERTAERLYLLSQLDDLYRRLNDQPARLALYEHELKSAQDPAYRARLQRELRSVQLRLADELQQGGKPQEAMALYAGARASLPASEFRERYLITTRMDAVHKANGDYPARLALYAELEQAASTPEFQQEVRFYRAGIYQEWARSLAEAQPDVALDKLREGARSLKPEDWQMRYELTAEAGALLLQRDRFGDLVLLYEDLLPSIPDERLKSQIGQYVGQVYLEWGRRAQDAGNDKSMRIRYHAALDWLPADDWQRRLSAINPLATQLVQENKAGQATALYESLIPKMPAGTTRQQYALHLGLLYRDAAHQPEKAAEWMAQADDGGNGAVALEAAYTLAELELDRDNTQQGRKLLEALVQRDLSNAQWLVPIHYKLALVLHGQNELHAALKHYRIVAEVGSAEVQKLYPRTISQSREQAQAISTYLQARGNAGGGELAVPRLQR